MPKTLSLTYAQRQALLAALQQPTYPRKAAKGAALQRCYPRHLNVKPGGFIPNTTIQCPNGAEAVLSRFNWLYWMDRTTGKEIANEKPTSRQIAMWRKRYA